MFSRKAFLPPIVLVIAAMLFIGATALFERPGPVEQPPELVIGLVLTDSEDDWKTALYESIARDARAQGIQVMTISSTRTQSDQIDAIRTFLVYRVSAILFSPVMESGWEYILSEAADADIPLVTLSEKLSDAETEGRPVYHVGYDYYTLTSELASAFLQARGDDFRLVQLGGTVASWVSAQVSGGFRDKLDAGGNARLGYSINSDFMRSRAYQLISGLLKNEYEFNTILSCSDAMTLGAIDALTEYGLEPGKDVSLLAVGGGGEAMEAFSAGYLDYLGRCDPEALAGRAVETVRALARNTGVVQRETLLRGQLLVGGGSLS
ncbi:substrate-binding domain-containing protein [Agathobaculum sp.]|uniref:substrate-binding domain-containing protein n=1 Tax=Agathobaculum sp. TaxID=2048138 RepID=UPI002A7F80BE|nr:substrate-binding domain-containing protein [Agathobaculum sp.]MDY3619148.1 substrate-binding domain-containing protein [Agathobaculum sp.]